MHELGFFECFGEDPETASNFLLPPEILAKRPLPHTLVSVLPTEFLSLRKLDFYTYLDDVARKLFITNHLKHYPEDEDLRRWYFEQKNFQDYRSLKDKRVPTPELLKRDQKRKEQLELEDSTLKRERARVILPRLDKKQQNRERLMENKSEVLDRKTSTTKNTALDINTAKGN